MKFGMMYELQLPKPWDAEASMRLFAEEVLPVLHSWD